MIGVNVSIGCFDIRTVVYLLNVFNAFGDAFNLSLQGRGNKH